MTDITLDAYIFFKGNCREAMEFYKSIFGGELTVQTYDDVPGPTPESMEGQLMHAMLEGGEVKLMGSDTAKASSRASKISLSLGGDDEEKLTKIFDQLSKDVDVQYPLKKEFWGDTFGSLTDKYGVDWMVNIRESKE